MKNSIRFIRVRTENIFITKGHAMCVPLRGSTGTALADRNTELSSYKTGRF